MSGKKRFKNLKYGSKKSKIQNQPKIISCNFLRHQTTYGCIWYAKQNPPYRGLSGWKDVWYSQHMTKILADKVDTLSLTHPVVQKDIFSNGNIKKMKNPSIFIVK